MAFKDLAVFAAFAAGAIIGSFLNVCIYRLPKKESIILPGSYCPHCKKHIKWYDNVPIISYVLLLGRCASCKKKISPRYPAVEALTAVLFTLLYINFGLHVKFFAYSALTCALIVAAWIDIYTGEISDVITLGGMAAGLIASCAFPALFDTSSRLMSMAGSALGIAAGAGSILVMGAAGKFIFKKEAMGGGDVTLMALTGSFIGWKLALLTFFIAPFPGAVVGLMTKGWRGEIPYGPYLAIAAIISMMYGNVIIGFLFTGF